MRFAQDMKLTATLGANPSASKKVAEWVRDRPRAHQIDRVAGAVRRSPNEAFGGTQAEGKYTPKDAYDAAEAGMNLWLQNAPRLRAQRAGRARARARSPT
jgi:hypothetical protein